MSEIAGVHQDNVERFFAAHVPGGNGALSFSLISGGRSNLTYLVRCGDRSWVLRRPPLGHVLPTAHDMVREHRVLSALADTAVPVPRPVALCDDPTVNDAPFYVMEYRPGIVLGDDIPAGYATTAEERRRISTVLVDTLVQLHAVDYAAVGLADFGRPDGYLERQVRRWAQQWERSKTSEAPAIDELSRRLAVALPQSPPPTIVHGDYRLGNVALDPNDPGRIVAIFDWEMATLGDPLADLGYTLIYWTEAGDAPLGRGVGAASSFTSLPGFFTRAEIINEYARRSGRNLDAVDFYQVLALYKLAVISEGIYARYHMGKTLGDGFEGMTRTATDLAARALYIADSSSDRRLKAGI
ncbi:MAG: phosphotransferase family protein [Deltaproteobacteria bacterium]|nr:phosphotransferase family protein [Deltaproteobacteria bacterium]